MGLAVSAYVDTVESPAKYNVTGSVGLPVAPPVPVDVTPPSAVLDVPLVLAPPAPTMPPVVTEFDTPFCVDSEPLAVVIAVAPPIPELLALVLASVAEFDDTVAELVTEPVADPITVALDPVVETASVVELAPSLVVVATDLGPEFDAASGSPQPTASMAPVMTAQAG